MSQTMQLSAIRVSTGKEPSNEEILEQLTIQFLRGELTREQYKSEVNNIKSKFDLRRLASNIK